MSSKVELAYLELSWICRAVDYATANKTEGFVRNVDDDHEHSRHITNQPNLYGRSRCSLLFYPQALSDIHDTF